MPVVAYVGGPGEISYFAQLRQVFKLFNHNMPVIFPRPNITLVEPLMSKLMKKYQITVEEIFEDSSNIVHQYLKESDTLGINTKFNMFRSNLFEQHSKLVKEVSSLDPELKALAQENIKRLKKVINSFEEKVKQRHRKKNQEAVRQITKLAHMLQPLGIWQERIYNVFPFLMKYNIAILEDIYNTIDVYDWRQKIIYFD
ncbi:hypothetical protein N752_11485 [Desulforamulus aquiferis]|nr:hypothetical protein N752_11485 [Desulforamulus aquiferis]